MPDATEVEPIQALKTSVDDLMKSETARWNTMQQDMAAMKTDMASMKAEVAKMEHDNGKKEEKEEDKEKMGHKHKMEDDKKPSKEDPKDKEKAAETSESAPKDAEKSAEGDNTGDRLKAMEDTLKSIQESLKAKDSEKAEDAELDKEIDSILGDGESQDSEKSETVDTPDFGADIDFESGDVNDVIKSIEPSRIIEEGRKLVNDYGVLEGRRMLAEKIDNRELEIQPIGVDNIRRMYPPAEAWL